jgi:hypothetical protein
MPPSLLPLTFLCDCLLLYRRKFPKQKPYNKTHENEEAQDNVTKTVEAECQTDITGDNHREMLRKEVRAA